MQLTTQSRNATYGPPNQDFQRTADMLTPLFRHMLIEGAEFQSHHVAMIMGILKLSRLAWSPEHKDSWTDLAGYAACGYECVVLDAEERNAKQEG